MSETGQEYRFNPNDPVAHIENLDQKLIVKEIKRRVVEVSSGEIEKGEDGKQVFKKVKKNKIDGILVYWWEEQGNGQKKKLKEEKFHSELLIRWDVAEKGQEEVDKWIKSRKEFQLRNYR